MENDQLEEQQCFFPAADMSLCLSLAGPYAEILTNSQQSTQGPSCSRNIQAISCYPFLGGGEINVLVKEVRERVSKIALPLGL